MKTVKLERQRQVIEGVIIAPGAMRVCVNGIPRPDIVFIFAEGYDATKGPKPLGDIGDKARTLSLDTLAKSERYRIKRHPKRHNGQHEDHKGQE